MRNSGAAELRLLPKNPVKAKLIRRTEEELKRNIDAKIVSENDDITNPEVGNVEKESDDLDCLTEKSYASPAARTGDQKSARNQNMNNDRT